MSGAASDNAALLVRHEIAPEARERYEAWLAEVTQACRQFPGFQGAAVIRPEKGEDTYTVMVNFATHAQLMEWVGSAQRLRLVEALHPLLRHAERIRAGMGLWCAPALTGAPQAKPYKQFLLTYSAIYPLSQVVPAALGSVTTSLALPDFLAHLITTGVMVWLMVYWIMPRYVRAVAGWLFH
ncbi:antibiotic biosynthesis monooxygenase [Burkholderia arboris]|uniref:Antibiotic biosynthesis monooxygenase n=1 Tax=Burkholderia arboris TaxID=488730 RepID=A0ABZ3DSG2_9BURK